MNDSKKPFVCYKGRMSLKIAPRNAAGWRATGWWMVAFIVLTGLFVWVMKLAASSSQVGIAVTAYILAATVWAVAMTLWMKARSEVIDLEELLALKRERDNRIRRGRKN
jgi:hypothetical protein